MNRATQGDFTDDEVYDITDSLSPSDISGEDDSSYDPEILTESAVRQSKPIPIPFLAEQKMLRRSPPATTRSRSTRNFDRIMPKNSKGNGKKTVSKLNASQRAPQVQFTDDFDSASESEPETEESEESESESDESEYSDESPEESPERKPRKSIKGLGKMTVAELKKMQKPLNQKKYDSSQKKAVPKKGRPSAGENKGKWSDTIECAVCGKKIKRGNRSAHNKTVYHKIYAEMNEKMRALLFTKK